MVSACEQCSIAKGLSIKVEGCGGGGGGTTRPLPRDGGTEELRGDPTVEPHAKVWTIDQK